MGSDAEDHHVHFDSIKDDFESDHSNPVIQKAQGKINIHLGFLQVKHRYRIELKIPADILSEFIVNNHKLVLRLDETAVPNINCKLLSFKGDTTGDLQFYDAEIEFFAHKEKLLKEELKLLTSDEKSVRMIFSARVLGRGKGTPMLKNGIHLLGIEDDEESDASDWQGFSRKECDEL
ncbi:CLUMA_CG011351, isoform A [Clunio marinus]|uniref:Adipose-secreted signaling protein n=1 Tax=Clunio marinus TaxID=568069 RepID=A0A1J1ICP9_9DIPT|nr:CLUMA_CG011351, isoform A [Clunio marinus]